MQMGHMPKRGEGRRKIVGEKWGIDAKEDVKREKGTLLYIDLNLLCHGALGFIGVIGEERHGQLMRRG